MIVIEANFRFFSCAKSHGRNRFDFILNLAGADQAVCVRSGQVLEGKECKQRLYIIEIERSTSMSVQYVWVVGV